MLSLRKLMAVGSVAVVCALGSGVSVAQAQSTGGQPVSPGPSRWITAWDRDAEADLESPAAAPEKKSPVADRDATYLSLSGGLTFIDETEITGARGVNLNSNELEFDPGYAATLAYGKYFGSIRAEAEGSWRYNQVDRLNVFRASETEIDGDLWSASLMGNLYWDIPILNRLDAYIGGGAGITYVDGEFEGKVRPFIRRGVTGELQRFRDEDNDFQFVYQLMVGTSYQLTSRTALTAEYRFWTTEDLEFGAVDVDQPLMHAVHVGLRFDL